MTTEYDAATALERLDDGALTADLDPAWFVVGPNGGYLAALLLRAAESAPESAGRPARSMSIQYPQVGHAGPARLEVEVSRSGRSMTFATVRMRQSDRLLAQAMVALGHGRSDLAFQDVRPPELPHPEDSGPAVSPTGMTVPIAGRFDYRPATALVLGASDTSEFWCWLRLRQPRPVDAGVLSLMVDALFPAMFARRVPPHVYPTVDLTVHLRNVPEPAYDDWCLAHAVTRTASEGFIEEDCDIYDRSGALLAQGRQLALIVPLA